MKPLILLILGTAREGNESQKAFNYVRKQLEARDDLELKTVECAEYIHNKTIAPWQNDPIINPWKELVAKASGFVIITPEYNHGYPGELKLLLDQEFNGYKGKAVLVGGVSDGMWGGTRVIEALVPVLRDFDMRIVRRDLHFPNIKQFNPEDEATDKLYSELVKKSIDELLSKIG